MGVSDGDGSVDGAGDGDGAAGGGGGGDAVAVAADTPLGNNMDVIGTAESARAISANLELFVRPPAPGRAPPHCPVFVLFFFCTLCRFLFGELMVPHE